MEALIYSATLFLFFLTTMQCLIHLFRQKCLHGLNKKTARLNSFAFVSLLHFYSAMVALKSIQRNIAYNEHFRHFRCNFSPVRAWASLLSHRNRSESVCLYQESPRSAPNEYHLDDTDNFDDQDKDWDDVNQDEGYREVLNSMTRPRARLWRRTTAAFELAVRAIVSICTWRQFLFNECRWGRWRIMWFYLEESLMLKVIWWRLLMMINLYPESQSPASLRGGTHPQASLQAECLVVGDRGDV